MNKTIPILAMLLLIGSLAAVDLGAISTTPTKLAAYSYQTTLKNGSALSTDTVKNAIDTKTNTLLDCDILTCDYKVEVNAMTAQTWDASTLKGLFTGEGVTAQKTFYQDTRQVQKERPIYADEMQETCTTDNKTSIKTCENTTVKVQKGTETYYETEAFENTAVTTPFAKGEARTYVIRFVKSNPFINTDIYHSIFGQERKDAAWWNASWAYAIPIDINTTATSSLTNFPAFINISTSNSTLWNTTTCTNVRFLDSTNTSVLNYDLDSSNATFCGNATNKATFWVGVNTTNSTAAYTRIYAYLGNKAAGSGENEAATWRNATYVGVWHFSEIGTPTVSTMIDSAGYNNIATVVAGTGQALTNISTPLGFGVSYNGTSISNFAYHRKASPVALPIGAGAWSVSLWVNKPTNTGKDGGVVVGFGTPGANTYSEISQLTSTSKYRVGGWNEDPSGFVYVLGAWELIQANSTTGASGSIWTNAVLNTTGTIDATNLGATTLGIGADQTGSLDWFNGTITEVRIRNVSSTADWFKAEYAQTATVGATMDAPMAAGTLTVNYTSGGTATGSNSTFTPPANLTINATANAGYYFVNWTENCNGAVANITNPNTQIEVLDSVACYAQANFANATPTMQTATILPAIAHQNDILLGHCNGTTANAQNITYNYTWYRNGVVNRSGTYPGITGNTTQNINVNVDNITATLTVGQNWTLQCLPYNANGAGPPLNSSNNTILSTTPIITSITISPASPTKATNLTCNITATDIEHAVMNITGNWTKNGAVLLAFTYNGIANGTDTAVSNLTPGNFSKGDNITCSASAFDGFYWSALNTSANKTILNSAPTGPTVDNFINATTSHSFTVNGSATDLDGGTDITTVAITPSLGTCVKLGNTSTGTLFTVQYNCTSTAAGSAAIMIGFTDASSAYANNSSTNAYPDHAASMTSPTITPATIYTLTVVTCNMGLFSDIDNDTENVLARAYAWQYNGGATGITTATFDLGAYGANNSANVSCSITATNSTWAGSNATTYSANTTITPNYAPKITIQNTFTNSTTGHSFTVFAGANDTDVGDSINFTNITTTHGTCAYVSNSSSGGEMNVTYLCTATTQGTTNITIRFTDTIVGNYNTTTSTNNTYPDHAPALTAPYITPALAHLNDTLTCNPGVFSDVDGDIENTSARAWQWHVNGVLTAITQTLPPGAFTTYDNITCTENSTNSSWTLTAQTSSAVFTNVLGFFYTSYGNISGVNGFGAAFDYSASAMTIATGNADAFGLLIMATFFIGFYIIGSRYTQERAVVYATFVTTVVAFLLVSGNFLSPNWLILSIIALLAAIYFANRVG